MKAATAEKGRKFSNLSMTTVIGKLNVTQSYINHVERKVPKYE